MVMRDQPLAVFPSMHVSVAGMHLFAVGKLEGVGANILRYVAANLDDTVVITGRMIRLGRAVPQPAIR